VDSNLTNGLRWDVLHSLDTREMRKNGTLHQLFIYFKKAYDSISREVLCDIVIETNYSEFKRNLTHFLFRML
jgi:hypothetical protein